MLAGFKRNLSSPFFFPDKRICPVSTAVYLQIFLAHVPINPKLCPQLSTSVFTVATLCRHTLPVFGWTILTVTITTVPVTNAATLACFFFSYISAFFPCSYNSSWCVWQLLSLPSRQVLLSWPTSTCNHWHISMAYYINESRRFTRRTVPHVHTHTHAFYNK